MKTTSYKNYKCNGFTLKYYSRSYIRDGVYYGEYVVAYYNGRRIVDRSTSEKCGLYDIICRLSDEERRRTTDAYIKENAARMGVAPCIVEAHIEEVQKKNSRAAVPAPKMEITAADIALYDYALGGAPVDGYTIGCADAVLKLMKKEGITPAAVDRARKKMKKQQPAPAAPVVDAPAADDAPAAPVIDAPAADTPAAADADVLAARAALIKEYEAIKQQAFDRIKSNYEAIKADISRDEKMSIANKILDEINYTPKNCNPDTMIEYLNMYLNGIITANEFKNATLNAMNQQPAADTFADAITAYCAALEEPAAPAWDNTPAADEQPAPAPRHRRNLNIAPRLSRWLHPARWVAAAYIVCLLSGLLLGVNTSTAVTDADAAADDIAAVYDLAPVTVTAASLTTAPPTPSPVKKLATPSPVKKAAADAVTLPGQKNASDIATATAPAADDAVTPSNQKTASDIAAVTDATAAADADGLTICAGTAWAYEMMHWA